VRVDDAGRAGLVDDVRSWLGPGVVEVRVLGGTGAKGPAVVRHGRTPHELFAEFLAEQQLDDPRLGSLFAELLDAETAT
jgi:exonuclease SbcD